MTRYRIILTAEGKTPGEARGALRSLATLAVHAAAPHVFTLPPSMGVGTVTLEEIPPEPEEPQCPHSS